MGERWLYGIAPASAPSGNFDLVFQQGGGRMVGRLRSLAKSAKALRLPTIQANL
ncbi:50S ribosomal protein L18 [Desmospora sp. 8437]|nr:50S ribosomal protein L18 [Desmospora sp. 8437]